MSTNDTPEQKRPLSVPHLVFGLVFAGIATVWFIGQATNADLPRSAIGFPVVLIGAGVIGLIASLAGSRRRSQHAAYAQQYSDEYTAHYAAQYDPGSTVVLDRDAEAPTDSTEEKS